MVFIAAGGAAGGFVGGFGNSILNGESLGTSLRSGGRSALVGGITGGITGGIEGGLRAREYGGDFWTGKGNFKDMFANEYVIDVQTGKVIPISKIGGDVFDVYYGGISTDAGTAYLGTGFQKIIERNKAINTFRFFKNTLSTISAFHIPSTGQSGYFLEPKGPSTAIANQNQRIPTGTYNLTEHNGDNYKDVYKLYNKQVSQDRGILIHLGNFPEDTEGCLLPGSYFRKKFVGDSRTKLEIINSYIRNTGVHKVTINIFEVF